MAHMDWHFKVNQRMKELEQREQHGLHMCLYVDELEWIRWEEAIDADYHLVQASRGNTGGGSGIASGGKISDDSTNKIPLKEQWIRVPDDTRLKASVCPICQEKFQTSWLDEAQEFVWMDAVKVGDRVFHATCHAEAFGGREHVKDPLQQIGRNTPDRVLGKRKAEVSLFCLSLSFCLSVFPCLSVCLCLSVCFCLPLSFFGLTYFHALPYANSTLTFLNFLKQDDHSSRIRPRLGVY